MFSLYNWADKLLCHQTINISPIGLNGDIDIQGGDTKTLFFISSIWFEKIFKWYQKYIIKNPLQFAMLTHIKKPTVQAKIQLPDALRGRRVAILLQS